MITHQTFKQQIDKRSKEALVKELGYGSLKKGIDAIEAFLATGSIDAWLAHGHYDIVHNSESFLRALTSVLGLPREEVEECIVRNRERVALLGRLQRPYIFVYTGFRRKSEPIFALAALESKRNIGLDKETVYSWGLEETLKRVGTLVAQYYRENQGRLALWGNIESYVYHHIDGKKYVFGTDGKLKEGAEPLPESRAEILVKNRPIVFGNACFTKEKRPEKVLDNKEQ